MSTRWLVLVLLVLGLGFRLWALPSARFTGDESDYWYKSRQVAVGASRPVYGPEITGSAAHLPGPAYYYLMAVPQAAGSSPFWGSGFVALLHVLTAFLLTRLVWLARGPRAGALAMALVAFAPWDVLYGDRIWGSCVVPVWGALALYGSARARANPRWLGVVVFLAIVLPQLHLSSPILWAACAAVVILQPPARWPWRAIGVGFGLAVVAYLPPLIAELQSNFANTRSILAHGGGHAPWAEAVWSPVKVFGYAVLYGSSEIGYHWARGYWGGGFSEADAYFTLAGLKRWGATHGPALGAAHAVSVLVAAVGWALGLAGAAAAGWRALRARDRGQLNLESTLSIGLIVGLTVGAALLTLARKAYFPHYANILMPVVLAPMVFGLDRLAARARYAVSAGVAVSMAAMVVGTANYYRTIDALNGLGPTLSMVDQVMADEAPSQVRFTHFNNRYAWQVIAHGVHGRSLPAGSGAVTYTVRNQRVHDGPLPDGGTLHGPVLLHRRPPTGVPEPRVSVAWRSIRVTARDSQGRQTSCAATGPVCRYGPQPWQKLEPTILTVGGRPRPLLFMHPIGGAVVAATIPVPAGVQGGELQFALSDDATRSNNRAPVSVVLKAGPATLAKGVAANQPGLRRLPFTLTSTQPVSVEIRTTNDGARVFGFDVRWSPPR